MGLEYQENACNSYAATRNSLCSKKLRKAADGNRTRVTSLGSSTFYRIVPLINTLFTKKDYKTSITMLLYYNIPLLSLQWV